MGLSGLHKAIINKTISFDNSSAIYVSDDSDVAKKSQNSSHKISIHAWFALVSGEILGYSFHVNTQILANGVPKPSHKWEIHTCPTCRSPIVDTFQIFLS